MSTAPQTAALSGRKKAIGHRSLAIGEAAKPPAAMGHESQNTSSPEGAKEMRGLPSGWRWARMNEVCSRVQDGTHFSPKEQTRTGDFKYITAKNIKHWGLDLSHLTYVPERVHREIYRRCNVEKGDVLYIKDGVTTGIATVNTLGEEFSLLSSVALLKPRRDILDSLFLKYYLNSSEGFRNMTGQMTGTAIKRLILQKIKAAVVPVAPLSEQRRIVAEIEKQFTRLEAGVAALRRVQANLKRYRAAVLKSACEGRLVASDLSAWKRLKVSEIGEVVTGNTPPTSDKGNLGDELPFFKPTDLDAGYNVREARQYLSTKGSKLARVLPAGSVLVTCIGATIGKTGFARVDCATNQQINALVVNPKVATPEWAFWSFRSPDGQQQIKNNASATTLPIPNKSKFEALEVPLPPLAEQTRIVSEVERRLSVVEELEAVVSANLQRATRLRQSILQKAFTGELS